MLQLWCHECFRIFGDRMWDLGRAVQVDPITPVLKPPGSGSMLLKLRCDGPLSNVAFNFISRRYTSATRSGCRPSSTPSSTTCWVRPNPKPQTLRFP